MNNTTTILPPTCHMIVRLFRFQLLVLMVLNGLISNYLNGRISFGATNVTGITKSLGKLFFQGKLVAAVEVNMGLNRFVLWLQEICGRIVIIGHVGAFDVKHFWNNVKK